MFCSKPRLLPASPAVRPGRWRRKRMQILLAEDNVVNQRVAVGLLNTARPRGDRRRKRAEGARGPRGAARSTAPMDVQMPEMGGLEATAAIRERERTPAGHLRIVAMTAYA